MRERKMSGHALIRAEREGNGAGGASSIYRFWHFVHREEDFFPPKKKR